MEYTPKFIIQDLKKKLLKPTLEALIFNINFLKSLM